MIIIIIIIIIIKNKQNWATWFCIEPCKVKKDAKQHAQHFYKNVVSHPQDHQLHYHNYNATLNICGHDLHCHTKSQHNTKKQRMICIHPWEKKTESTSIFTPFQVTISQSTTIQVILEHYLFLSIRGKYLYHYKGIIASLK